MLRVISRSAPRRRTLPSAVLTAVLAASSTVPFTAAAAAEPAAEPATSLAAAAALSGRYVGVALAANRLGEADYVATANREFSSVTPENEMKWDATEPQPGVFTFAAGDRVVGHAEAQGMEVRGHTLVWHSQLPAWTNALQGAPAAREAMTRHITALMGRYKGRIAQWDVVNEAFDDSPTAARRPSVWQTQIGPGYIEEAFRIARSVDPSATLCYNDYNTDGINAKSDAVYAMVKDFVARGVPIDCVGFQSHFNSNSPLPADYEANLKRFAALGVDVAITELDIATSGTDPVVAGAQAESYRRATQTCLNLRACLGITVWGVTDKYSWRSTELPLPIGALYDPKPAYHAMLDTLNAAAPADRTAPVTTASVSSPRPSGWHTDEPTVTLTATDGGSGVATTEYRLDAGSWTTYTAPLRISAQGAPTLSFRSVDFAGNTEASGSLPLRVDTVAPQVTYTGNRTYTVDQELDIRCSATDAEPGSGLASTTCTNVAGPAYDAALGTTTVTATAADVAGSTGTGTGTYTVTVTFSSLRALVTRFSSHAAVANRLNDRLTAAEATTDPALRAQHLDTFESQLAKQTGKAYTQEEVALLTRLERALR